jgi:hypothetical protein
MPIPSLAARKNMTPDEQLAEANKILSYLTPSREDYQWACQVIFRREDEEDRQLAEMGIWPRRRE